MFNFPGRITGRPLPATRDEDGRWIGGSAEQWVEKLTALQLAPINILPSGDLALFGSFTGRQQLAAWLGMALPFMAALFFVEERGWRGWALLVSGIGAVALIATGREEPDGGRFAGAALVVAGVALISLG